MASVYIPVQGTAEEVRVALDQLPNDASDILDILKAEQAPLHLWLIIAREYFKQGKIEQFRQILEEGSGPEIDEYYAEVKYERIAILNALGAFHTFLGKVERAPQKEAHFKEATQYYNRASRIHETEPSTWIGKGQLCVAKGELQMASDSFKIVLDEDGNNFPALLGQMILILYLVIGTSMGYIMVSACFFGDSRAGFSGLTREAGNLLLLALMQISDVGFWKRI